MWMNVEDDSRNVSSPQSTAVSAKSSSHHTKPTLSAPLPLASNWIVYPSLRLVGKTFDSTISGGVPVKRPALVPWLNTGLVTACSAAVTPALHDQKPIPGFSNEGLAIMFA